MSRSSKIKKKLKKQNKKQIYVHNFKIDERERPIVGNQVSDGDVIALLFICNV